MKIGQLYTADCMYSYRVKAGAVLIDTDDVVMVTDVQERESRSWDGI